MILKTIQEIQQDLDKAFLPLEARGITGLRLIEGGLPEATIDYFEEGLGVSLPADFRAFLNAYDLGRLTLGPVAFCGNGQYLKHLSALNDNDSRPAELLVIANSDPYLILLNLKGGGVLALDHELGWEAVMPIARTFELFIRGLGTMSEARARRAAPASLAQAIAADAGVSYSPYWLTLVR